MAAQSPWNAFAAFQVFGDHVPMEGFSLLVRITPARSVLERLLEWRAATQPALDPELAIMTVRAGLGLLHSGVVAFAYANSEETIILLRRDAVSDVGQSLAIHDYLVSDYAARLALLIGRSLPAIGRIYELPDIGVVRKAFRAAVDDLEQSTPLRSATRLGAQLRGRGEPFHASMVETLEEQTSLLQHHGVDMDTLPTWWWRGIAARVGPAQGLELWSELPPTDDMLRLIA